MKKLFLLFVFCCFASGVSAQYVETVHLKNGGIIHGVIIEQTPNQSLKIRTGDGNVFVYSFDEIEKITKETQSQYGTPNGSYRSNERRPQQQFRTPRYQGSVDFGYSLGVGEWQADRIELSTSHGCLVNPYFYIGAGFGVHDYYDSARYGGSAVAIPIFADFRGNLLRGDIKPFLNFRIGYSVGDIKGLYFSPSIGVNYRKLDIGFGYTYQKTEVDSYYYDSDTINIGAITFKIGIRF